MSLKKKEIPKIIIRFEVKKSKVKYENKLGDAPIKTYSGGQSKGALFGGNLSVITSLIGSGYLPDWNGKIVFLEDVKEEPYRIDRMLTQLKLAGVLDEVAGIAFGKFTESETTRNSFSMEQVLRERTLDLSVPVIRGLMIGHVEDQAIIPVGAMASLDGDRGKLTLLDSGLA